MGFQEILTENKIEIVKEWIEQVMSTYSPDGVRFFKKEKDRFANPLGYNATQGLEKVFEMLCQSEMETLPKELTQFVKLRAVQTFSPSDAMSFIFELKNIIFRVCGKNRLLEAVDEWVAFDRKIDRLALKVFDLYMEDRELIYKIKVNEYKRGNHLLTAAKCPSAIMRDGKQEKIELGAIQNS